MRAELVEVGPGLEGLPVGEVFCLWPAYAYGQSPALVRRLGDPERYVAVVPMLFTWAIVTGPIAEALLGPADRWCYADLEGAVVAAAAWSGEGEPDGWIRHPASGRRRPGGDRALEELRP